MNKKAQIHLFVLLTTIIFLFISSIFIMISFNGDLNFQSEKISYISKEAELRKSFVETKTKTFAQQAIENCGSCSADEIKEKVIEYSANSENLFRYEGAGNLYGKIRSRDFEVTRDKENAIISIKEIFVQSKKENFSVTKNFNICLNLNLTEKSITEC